MAMVIHNRHPTDCVSEMPWIVMADETYASMDVVPPGPTPTLEQEMPRKSSGPGVFEGGGIIEGE